MKELLYQDLTEKILQAAVEVHNYFGNGFLEKVVESPYFSIFGEVKIKRAGYSNGTEEYVYPLDARLNLPDKKFSYLLQKWILARSAETDFREAVDWFNEIFDFSFFPFMPQRTCASVALAVNGFYETRSQQALEEPREALNKHVRAFLAGKNKL